MYKSIMKYCTLPNGAKMPLLGLGTWQSPPGEVKKAVESAIKVGYRYFDCAWAYQNENEVGDALKNMMDQGLVRREELFIATKLHIQFLRKELVRKCFMESLTKLKLQYVDLYLIHGPTGLKYVEGNLFPRDENGKTLIDPVNHLETWKVLEELVAEGLIKNIGISNFNHKQIQKIYDGAKVKPSNLQVESNIYFQQKKLHGFCKEKNISFTAYAPLGSPGRPAGMGADAPNLLEDETLKTIANSKGKSPAQVALRFLVEEGMSVIPKSVNPERIKQNFEIFDFDLTSQDMSTLRAIDKNLRMFNLGGLINADHPDDPMKEEY